MSRASQDRRPMRSVVQALSGPEIEVVAKARRRRFPLDYKRKILREVDRCRTAGAVGALLRREGVVLLTFEAWRAARERGDLAGPTMKKRGPVALGLDPRNTRIAQLERESASWRKRAERAEALIDVQKKDAREYCHGFFSWYNTDHHHAGLGLLTPADVHHGRAEQRIAARAAVLAAAHTAHSERFPAGQPHPAGPSPGCLDQSAQGPGTLGLRHPGPEGTRTRRSPRSVRWACWGAGPCFWTNAPFWEKLR